MGVIPIINPLMRSCDLSIEALEPDLSFGQRQNWPVGVIKHLKSMKIIEMS